MQTRSRSVLAALVPKMMPYYQAPGVRPSHTVHIGPGAA